MTARLFRSLPRGKGGDFVTAEYFPEVQMTMAGFDGWQIESALCYTDEFEIKTALIISMMTVATHAQAVSITRTLRESGANFSLRPLTHATCNVLHRIMID